MPIRRKNSDILTGNFPFAPPPTDSLDTRIRRALSDALRRSRRSREQIADSLGISLAQLQAWTAESHHQHALPLRRVPALCRELGDVGLIEVVAGELGYALLDAREQRLVAFARAHLRSGIEAQRAEAVKNEILGAAIQEAR